MEASTCSRVREGTPQVAQPTGLIQKEGPAMQKATTDVA